MKDDILIKIYEKQIDELTDKIKDLEAENIRLNEKLFQVKKLYYLQTGQAMEELYEKYK